MPTSSPRRPPSQVSVSSRNSESRTNRNGKNGNGKKPRGRFWRGLGIVSLLIIAGGVAYGTLTQHGRDFVEAAKTGVPAMIAVKQNPNLIFDEAGSDHVNILLIGRDVNYKPAKVYDPTTKTYRPFHVVDKDSPARSDTMIVMSLDKIKGTMRLVSLPRDAMVRLPRNEYHVRRAKLNAAHAYGGPQLLIQTLHDELGLTIQHYAVIKFDGFKKLIDDVGGVEVNVEGALLKNRETGKLYRGNLKYDDNWGNLHQNLKPGVQILNGQQAHDYVRFREDLEGDTGRMRRQQSVMRALAKKIMHAQWQDIPTLVKGLRQQFDTDLTDEQLFSAANFTRGLNGSTKIQPITLFGVYSTRGSLTLNRPKNEKLLATIFGSTFNKENFLVRSPSTDEDEVGEANDSNAGAQEVLREAGLIKGAKTPDTKLAANNDASDTQSSTRTDSADVTSSVVPTDNSRDASTSDTSTSDVSASSAPPRDVVESDVAPRVRESVAPENRVVIASTDATPTPSSRRRRQRERERARERERRREANSSSSSSSRSERSRSSESRRSRSSNDESPVPVPESSSNDAGSSSDNGESPIPRAE